MNQPDHNDMWDAIEHASIDVDSKLHPDQFDIKYLGMMKGDDIDQFDDLSSWGELFHDPNATPEERLAELESFRGQPWAEKALSWIKNGIPPIIVITVDGHTMVGDGRGRTNFATLFDMSLPVYHMQQRDVMEEINDIRRRAGLSEEKMVDVWHVTEKQNVPNILQNGLEPRIGKSSKSAGEQKPAIYVFPDELSMEDAVTNWLGDETEYRQSALILRVPESWVSQDNIRWEATINRPVPPDMIKVAIPDLDETG